MQIIFGMKAQLNAKLKIVTTLKPIWINKSSPHGILWAQNKNAFYFFFLWCLTVSCRQCIWYVIVRISLQHIHFFFHKNNRSVRLWQKWNTCERFSIHSTSKDQFVQKCAQNHKNIFRENVLNFQCSQLYNVTEYVWWLSMFQWCWTLREVKIY